MAQFRRCNFVACDFREHIHCCLLHEKIMSFNTTINVELTIKHVSKSYDGFCAISNNSKHTVGLTSIRQYSYRKPSLPSCIPI